MTEKKSTAPVWDVDEKPFDEVKISLVFSRHSKPPVTMQHIFREPTAGDKRKHRRHLARTKINKQRQNVIETDVMGANENLWNACILQVTGYSVDNTANNWKDKIPFDHKAAAIEKLFLWAGIELDEDDAKN